jgi:hypothetical protein
MCSPKIPKSMPVRGRVREELVDQVAGRDAVVRAHLLDHAAADQAAHRVGDQPHLRLARRPVRAGEIGLGQDEPDEGEQVPGRRGQVVGHGGRAEGVGPSNW